MSPDRVAEELNQGINNGEIAGSGSFVLPSNTVSSSQGIDYNHPLFLSPTDVSGVSLISFQLLGIENYTLWNRSITLALLGRNKIGLVDGSCRNEVYGEELWGQWERVNAIVLSWLMNSVSKSLLSGVAFASSALQVWNDLKERFDRVDGSRTYSLHKDIVTMQQGTNSVSEYYTRLKTLWDESELLVPAPCCNCDKSKGFVAHMNRQKLYQFLMGLNESFQQARSQILMLNPLPTINHAYAMIVGDESQKAVMSHSNSMGMNTVSADSVAISAVNFQELSEPAYVSYNPEHEGPEHEGPEPDLANQEFEQFGDSEPIQHMPENSADNLTAVCDPLAEPRSGSSSSGNDTLMNSSQEGQLVVVSPEIRRSTRAKQSPAWLTDFVTQKAVKYPLGNYVSYNHLSSSYQCYIAASSSLKEPSTYSEAVTDQRWIDAMQLEIQALESNNTWVVTDLPQGKKPIGCR
ncbi:uncharacterized protein LOC125806940 [Solanum verrucosum]|uniref:uncharacterized protein LOC125806940 n=1 Tax=Solanum verrucosum TaxID=315347 RepID=UPI0020D1E932|nr:uncharacterized protein LOC125806940 [Solanum verrucosum]